MSKLQPNATSSYLFAGYDISQAYPGSGVDSEKSWKYGLSLYGNMKQESNATRFDTWLDNTIGADLPDDIEADGSWTFCLKSIMSDKMLGKVKSGKEDEINEDCDGLLSSKCRDAMLASLENGAQCDTGGGIPDACEDDLGGTTGSHWVTVDDDFVGNVTDGGTISLGGFAGSHSYDDFESYDAYIRQVYVQLMGFGETPDDEDEHQPRQARPGILKCVYVGDVADGSRTRKEAEESSAGNLGLPKWLMGMAAVSAATFLLQV